MKKYDLIVVGGGILGTFHAYHALNQGLNVLLLEKDNYPIGATVRNFGQAVPSGMVGQWFQYGVRGLGIYQEIQQEFDISVRNNGSIYIASDADETQLLHELKSHYDTVGYPCELLTKQALMDRYPAVRSSYAREGLFFPQEVSIEPNKMIYRVHEYMRQKYENFTLHYSTPAVNCEERGSDVEVGTSTGKKFCADRVVICSGNEVKLLFPEIYSQSGQVVSKLQMMRTIPMPQVELEGNILTGLTIRRYESFEAHCPSFKTISTPEHYHELKAHGIHILFKKAPDGSIIIGDSHDYADTDHIDDLGYGLDEHINELMLTEAERIVDFDVRKVAAKWAGYYPQHNENHIVEIVVSKNVFIRTAIGGKGMTAGIGYSEASLADILM